MIRQQSQEGSLDSNNPYQTLPPERVFSKTQQGQFQGLSKSQKEFKFTRLDQIHHNDDYKEKVYGVEDLQSEIAEQDITEADDSVIIDIIEKVSPKK